MIEFEVAGKAYRADKLHAFQQFHIQRRIAPLIPPLLPLAFAVMKKVPLDQIRSGKVEAGMIVGMLPELAPLLQVFADGLASLPDEPLDYVMKGCLAVVKREAVGGNWTPVWNAKAGFMFDDANDAGTALQIVARVLIANLGPFIQGLLMSQPETSEAKPAA